MSDEYRDPGDHPDLADLDAFRTGEASADVRSHVEGCERCRRVAGELGELSELVGEIGSALGPPAVDVPADVDGNIRAMARARAAAIRGRARGWRAVYFSWPGWVAAAAMIMTAVGLTLSASRREAATDASRLADAAADTADTMDIDRSGAVDIVDAYLMSRRITSKKEISEPWDFDRDGRVGEADVDEVAMRAVALVDGGI